MLAHFNSISKVFRSKSLQVTVGSLHTTSNNFIKQIVENKNGNRLEIEAVFTSSPREATLLKLPGTEDPNCCALCRLGLHIKHTDVLILSQYLRSDGCMLPKRITQLCNKQQKRVSALVAMAQKAGLMSNINPPNSKKDTTKRKSYTKFNSYWDESTIPKRI